MKKSNINLFVAAALSSFFVSITASYAQNNPASRQALTEEQRDMVKERLQNATPEKKEEFKQKAREKWQNASPEQKEARKAKVRERVKNMSPEEKARVKEKIKSRRATHGANAR